MPRDARVFVFDHVSIGVEDLERAADFYDACLAPLGHVRLWRNARGVGYGPEGYRDPDGHRLEAVLHER